MNKNGKNWGIIVILCVVIITAVEPYDAQDRASRHSDAPNPNVTLVTAPDQTGFEEHPEWTIPETEPIDYGENIALGKDVRQNGQTQIYNCRNVNDGDRFTYWEARRTRTPTKSPSTWGSPWK